MSIKGSHPRDLTTAISKPRFKDVTKLHQQRGQLPVSGNSDSENPLHKPDSWEQNPFHHVPNIRTPAFLISNYAV